MPRPCFLHAGRAAPFVNTYPNLGFRLTLILHSEKLDFTPDRHSLPQVGLTFELKELADSFRTYVTSGSLVLVRTVGKILTYTVCAREAALLGTAAAAAYNVCFQLGTATTQICESISVAAQSLLARELAGRDPARVRAAARHIIARSLQLGGIFAGTLSFFTWANQANVLASLAADPAIRVLAAGIMPLVLWTQLVKGFAYPVNGMPSPFLRAPSTAFMGFSRQFELLQRNFS
jgi:Na+-driven multidrug efflux pump